MINKLDLKKVIKEYDENHFKKLNDCASDFLEAAGRSPKEEKSFVSSGDVVGFYFPSVMNFFQYSIVAVAGLEYSFNISGNNSVIVLKKNEDSNYYYIDFEDFEAVLKLQCSNTFSRNYKRDNFYIKKIVADNIFIIYKSSAFNVEKYALDIHREGLVINGNILTFDGDYKDASLEAKAAKEGAFLKIVERYDAATLSKVAGYNKQIEATPETKRERLETLIGWEFNQGFKFTVSDNYAYEKDIAEIVYFYTNKNKYASDYENIYADMLENCLQKGKNFYNSVMSEKVGRHLDKKTLEEFDHEINGGKLQEVKKSDAFKKALEVKKALVRACELQYKSVKVVLHDGTVYAADPAYNYISINVLENGSVRYILNFGYGKCTQPADVEAITYRNKNIL